MLICAEKKHLKKASVDDSINLDLDIEVRTSSSWLIDANKIQFKDLVYVGQRSYTHKAIYDNIKVFATIPYKQTLNDIAKEDLKSKCLHVRYVTNIKFAFNKKLTVYLHLIIL